MCGVFMFCVALQGLMEAVIKTLLQGLWHLRLFLQHVRFPNAKDPKRDMNACNIYTTMFGLSGDV